jgi:hypothetical protein
MALKFLPGVFLLPTALARDWRAATSMIASAAVLVLVPTLALQLFDGPKSPPGAQYLLGTPAILSWSVPSTVLRVYDPPVSNGALPRNWEFGNRVTELNLPANQRTAATASSAAVLIVGALLLVWRTRGRIASQRLPLAMAGFLSLALAAAPVCWSHYQVFQYPGIALMLGLAVSRHRWIVAGAVAVLGALLYPLPVAVLTHYYHRYGWTAASPWQLYLWTSATPAACLGIFALSLYAPFNETT